MWHCTPSYQSLNNITDFSNFFCHKLMENYKLYEAFHIAKECCCLYMHTPPFLCVSDSFCYFILNAQGCFQILNPLFFQSCKLLKISSWLEGAHLKSKFVRIGRNECKELYLNLCKGEGFCFFFFLWAELQHILTQFLLKDLPYIFILLSEWGLGEGKI